MPRRVARLTGWILAMNSLALLAAVALGGSAGDAARHVLLFCGLAR